MCRSAPPCPAACESRTLLKMITGLWVPLVLVPLVGIGDAPGRDKHDQDDAGDDLRIAPHLEPPGLR